jgi:hypothetical protein
MITITMPEWFLYLITVTIWLHLMLVAMKNYIAYLHAKWRRDNGKEYPHYDGESESK